MGQLTEWLDERRSEPWPFTLAGDFDMPAPAKALRDAFAEVRRAEDRTIPSQRDFGMAVKEAGFEPERTSAGHFYPGLTIESRAERARSNVRDYLGMREVSRLRAEADREHRARLHDGDERVPCAHEMPAEVTGRIVEARNAAVAALEADGTAADLLERWYGPYLRWRPHEPAKSLALAELAARRRQRDEAEIATLTADLAAVRARIVELRSDRAVALVPYHEAIARGEHFRVLNRLHPDRLIDDIDLELKRIEPAARDLHFRLLAAEAALEIAPRARLREEETTSPVEQAW